MQSGNTVSIIRLSMEEESCGKTLNVAVLYKRPPSSVNEVRVVPSSRFQFSSGGGGHWPQRP